MAQSELSPKPVHSIILDAGPILKNTPPLSTLLARSEELFTTPSVFNEIRDPDARSRVETLYLPFLKLRAPTPKSFNILSEFARKTGDRAVLSRTDIEVLALAYEVEVERNGGDWRLRSAPGQKHVNGKPPSSTEDQSDKKQDREDGNGEEKGKKDGNSEVPESQEEKGGSHEDGVNVDGITENLKATNLENGDAAPAPENNGASEEVVGDSVEPQESEPQAQSDQDSDSDSGGWITPSNLKKRQIRDESISSSAVPEPKVMQVATMTTDFAVSCSLPHILLERIAF